MSIKKLTVVLVLVLAVTGLAFCDAPNATCSVASCIQAALPMLLLLATYLFAYELAPQISVTVPAITQPLRRPPRLV